MDTPILQAAGVHKRFGTLEVLRGIDLTVRRGEVVALIGASGSGKTTLLRCINLLEEYDHGQIFVDGELIGYREQDGRRTLLPERVIARQRAHIGMVFQSFNLFPHMTAEGNIVLGLMRVQGKSRREATDWTRSPRIPTSYRVGSSNAWRSRGRWRWSPS